MDALWTVLTAPARLMSILWPLFILPLMFGILAIASRAYVINRVDVARVHPIMRSRFGWPVAVVVGTAAFLWVLISLTLFVLVLAAVIAAD